MKHQWHQLRDKFDALTARERGLIAIAVLAVLLTILIMPLSSMMESNQKLSREIKSVTQENDISNQQIAMYQAKLAEDPNADFRRRLDDLQQQLTDIEDRLESHNVVPSDVMPVLLNTMMASAKRVTVTGFESLPPKPLLDGDAENKINLYSHGAKLNIKGQYFDVLRFMQTVEKLPEKVYWKQLDYQVKDYPLAEVSLEFYTLSVNEEYISVAY
ncbi:MSHA biogenesis protein MshJ [Shewanella submarina]|uniref:MSHA biogenesis protein MshJ n=1 Tax=Shewanella submarina TaxID=2016376 RepID=A0ABV7GHK0_9GAMM|nr:MSHA biogenesis protein MshJ [Shewanella submarina]MCL1035607.1 MSHA biogenesis protein MshJ [Shewanella submarina]